MSGLLQRLAGQALSAHLPSATSRVRSEMSVHAQVPVSPSPDFEEADVVPSLAHETARLPTRESGPTSPAQRVSPQNLTTIIQSASRSRKFEPQPDRPRLADARASPPHAPREPPTEYKSRDFVEKAPPPLLAELQLTSAPPAVTPVPSAPFPVAFMSGDSRAEPTEVHVHIGRIEVIAAPEPVAPKKNRAVPERKTLPLADYLARRRSS